MKVLRILLTATVLWMGLLLLPQEGFAQRRADACRIQGRVFVTENRGEAHYSVYISEDEYAADVIVYNEQNHFMADGPGKWHLADYYQYEDIIVYFVDSPNQADFTIFYTDVPDFAGCNQ